MPVPKIVAVTGRTPSELKANAQAASERGLSVRLVTIRTPSGSADYSPYAAVVRSEKALLVRAYGRVYAYQLASAKVFYSGAPDHPIEAASLPLVHTPSIDAAFAGDGKVGADTATKAKLCGSCDFLLGVTKGLWSSAKDPWQVKPDYAFWKPGTDQNIANTRRASSYYYGYYYGYGAYYAPVEIGRVRAKNKPAPLGCDASQQYCFPGQGGNPFGNPPPPGTGGGGNTTAAAPCTPSGLPPDIAAAFSGSPAMQAVAQADAAKNNGVPPKVITVSPVPNSVTDGRGMETNVNLRTISLFPDNYPAYLAAGMTVDGMYMHEQLHIWYEIKGSDGIRPNPLPGDSNFVANPTIQLTNSAGQTVTVQFNLLNPNGTVNSAQYAGYEHMLIHDDMVRATGTDSVWTSLMDAMKTATSITTPDGVTTSLNNMTKAQANALAAQIIRTYNLFGVPAQGRGGTRPPTTPTAGGGCSSGTAGTPASAKRTNKSARTTRDFVDDVGVLHYNIDGFDLVWDGIPLP